MKFLFLQKFKGAIGSAPTRGPWIEIFGVKSCWMSAHVGPHTGAVD